MDYKILETARHKMFDKQKIPGSATLDSFGFSLLADETSMSEQT
jgi:hypothetical protein